MNNVEFKTICLIALLNLKHILTPGQFGGYGLQLFAVRIRPFYNPMNNFNSVVIIFKSRYKSATACFHRQIQKIIIVNDDYLCF